MNTSALAGLPARAALRADGLHIALLDASPSELHDPFVADTLKRLAATPLSLTRVPIEQLGRSAPAEGAPAGIIFHVGRCGSTLASQLLKQHKEVVVYSEPICLNEVLVASGATCAQQVGAIRALGSHFARHAGRPYVLKLSSWNSLFCNVVKAAFPETPWAICLRDPLEVCVSLLASPPAWLRPENAALFAELVVPDRARASNEERAATFFAAFCDSLRGIGAEHGLCVPYADLPKAAWATLSPHFGLTASELTIEKMAAASRLHAKAPTDRAAAFEPDEDRKRKGASAELRRAVDDIARPAYRRLVSHMAPPIP